MLFYLRLNKCYVKRFSFYDADKFKSEFLCYGCPDPFMANKIRTIIDQYIKTLKTSLNIFKKKLNAI